MEEIFPVSASGGDGIWDAIGTLLIGALLIVVAIYLEPDVYRRPATDAPATETIVLKSED
jgi:hypothetical protein